MKSRIIPVLALLLSGMAAEMQAAPSWSLSCPDSVKKLPRLVAADGVLEPSGVAWDPVARVAVGVSDEATPHALFAFDPAAVAGDNTIRATPLLTQAQVDQLRPKDMEAITRLPGGDFVATASHSLNKGKPRDSVLRFRLKKGSAGQPWVADAIQRIPPAAGFHSWLVQSANPPWDKKFNTQDGENGINLEGLAASLQDDQLFFGFRGPVTGGKPAVLAARVDGSGQPAVVRWHSLKLSSQFDVGAILGILGKEPLGVRDMTPIAGGKGHEFLLLMGASGSGSDLPFQLGWWRDNQDEVALVGRIPKGFRAEGVTVLSDSPEGQRLLLVSDKLGMVMECQTTAKKR